MFALKFILVQQLFHKSSLHFLRLRPPARSGFGRSSRQALPNDSRPEEVGVLSVSPQAMPRGSLEAILQADALAEAKAEACESHRMAKADTETRCVTRGVPELELMGIAEAETQRSTRRWNRYTHWLARDSANKKLPKGGYTKRLAKATNVWWTGKKQKFLEVI